MPPHFYKNSAYQLAMLAGLVFQISAVAQAQTILNSSTYSVPIPTATAKHVGSGPIDMNNLSAEILNCDVCRQRLGLPPLSRVQAQSIVNPTGSIESQTVVPSTTSTESSATSELRPNESGAPSVRMLGSPGLLSSRTAAKMATDGLVFEEFLPPKPAAGAIQLGSIPLEARQRILSSLDLPAGATIMSANILDSKSSGSDSKSPQSKAPETIPSPRLDASAKIGSSEALSAPSATQPRSLGAPGITVQPTLPEPAAVRATDAQSKLPVNIPVPVKPESIVAPTPSTPKEPNAEANAAVLEWKSKLEQEKLETQRLQAERDTQESMMKKLAEQQTLLQQERDAAAVQIKSLEESQRKLLEETMDRMQKIEEANRQALQMLEKRTAEVTQLQLQLTQRDEQEAKLMDEAKAKHAEKAESKKKKNKK
jgi:hypothetical protein